MRQWPSEQYSMIKRSFFSRGETSFQLDNCIVALKGVYSSIRLCDVSPKLLLSALANCLKPKSSIGGTSTGLAVNVDVANGTFWAAQDLVQAARNYIGGRENRSGSYTTMRDQLAPVINQGKITQSNHFKLLRKMIKLKFHVKHRSKADSKFSSM